MVNDLFRFLKVKLMEIDRYTVEFQCNLFFISMVFDFSFNRDFAYLTKKGCRGKSLFKKWGRRRVQVKQKRQCLPPMRHRLPGKLGTGEGGDKIKLENCAEKMCHIDRFKKLNISKLLQKQYATMNLHVYLTPFNFRPL